MFCVLFLFFFRKCINTFLFLFVILFVLENATEKKNEFKNQIIVITMSIARVDLLHPATGAQVMEKRFLLTQTIAQIKATCATHFQTPANEMKLKLIDAGGHICEEPIDDGKPLGFYQVRDGWTIEVLDLRGDKASYIGVGAAADEQVEKFELSEADYLKRPDNMRAVLQAEREKFKAERIAAGEDVPAELTDDSFAEEASKMKVGDRCQVSPGDRLGAVRYVGRLASLKAGFWIGVEFDEPVGKNDGTLKGAKVFECRPNYGGFMRPKDVEVGDFPPEDF